MKSKSIEFWLAIAAVVFCGMLVVTSGGCTSAALRESVKAVERVEEVQETIFVSQRQAIRDLAFKAMVNDLRVVGIEVDDPLLTLLAEYWALRDKSEFITSQWEKSKALDEFIVNRYLYSKQGILNILFEDLFKVKPGQQKEGNIFEDPVKGDNPPPL